MSAAPAADEALRLTALLQLSSPTLPVGAYSYSQALEAAVEQGVVADAADAGRWISDSLSQVLGRYEAPLWLRLRQAAAAGEWPQFLVWNEEFLATRETAELLAETVQMGYSTLQLLAALGHPLPVQHADVGYPTAHAWACVCWNIGELEGLIAYLYSWAENQVMAALKSIPLGQVAGQQLLLRCRQVVAEVATQTLTLPEHAMRSQSPGLAVLSSQHETQYSRLFRS